MKGSVVILPKNIRLEIGDDPSLLLLLLKNKIEISHVCGGFASCGTCRVFVESNVNDLPPRDEMEKQMAEDRDFKENERLACQLCPFNSLVVRVPNPIKESAVGDK